MKPLLVIVGIVAAVMFARAARVEFLHADPLKPIIAWGLFGATAVSAIWLARLKFAAWAALMAAMAIALNTLAPIQLPVAWEPTFNIACAVVCSACVVRNWN